MQFTCETVHTPVSPTTSEFSAHRSSFKDTRAEELIEEKTRKRSKRKSDRSRDTVLDIEQNSDPKGEAASCIVQETRRKRIRPLPVELPVEENNAEDGNGSMRKDKNEDFVVISASQSEIKKQSQSNVEQLLNSVNRKLVSSVDGKLSVKSLMRTKAANAVVISPPDPESPENQESLIDSASVSEEETADTALVPTKLNFFDFEDKKLVVIEQNTAIYVHGVVRISVIRGSVEVLGYILTNDGRSIDLYSPKGTSFLYIRAVNTGKTEHSKIHDSFAENEEVLNFLEQQTYDSSAIVCDTLAKPHINFIEKHVAQQMYPSTSARYVLQDQQGDWNVVNTSPDWDRVCDSIAPHSKAILCGGKGVGKSTFLRYAINRLLMKYKEIRVVDLDPGQPEFTVPGCVSVHTITEPVFGPNYTHIRKPERCIYLPNVNIGYNPKEYICAIQELLSVYKSEEELPVLINYMGFTQGVGLNIVCSAIAEVRPTIVVQIQSNHQKKNFSKLLTPECVTGNLLFPADITPEDFSYQFVTLNAMSDGCSGFTLQPRQIREMCVLAYMSQILPEGIYSLTDSTVPLFKSKLQNLKLIANGKECHPAVVNGNLVALCVVQSVYDDFKIYVCLGWGVVRGIDLAANEVFLLTPETESTLQLVTHLVYGSVNLPPSVYMTAEDVSGVVPYVSLGTLSSFSSIPKRTHLSKQVTTK